MITALDYSIKAFFQIAVQGYPKDKRTVLQVFMFNHKVRLWSVDLNM